MKSANINIFAAWFLIPHTLAMGWVAFAGRMVLEVFGMSTHEEAVPGRIVGALLVLAAVFLVQTFRGSLAPLGNPAGKGYLFGHRLVLAANILAALLFVFPFVWQFIGHRDVVMVLSKFAVAFGYWVMALWAVGFSFIYQSSLPVKAAN
ncbi:MAG TPA: hypothetical protein VIU93_13605 [Gallionellaceae bacterium]